MVVSLLAFQSFLHLVHFSFMRLSLCQIYRVSGPRFTKAERKPMFVPVSERELLPPSENTPAYDA